MVNMSGVFNSLQSLTVLKVAFIHLCNKSAEMYKFLACKSAIEGFFLSACASALQCVHTVYFTI